MSKKQLDKFEFIKIKQDIKIYKFIFSNYMILNNECTFYQKLDKTISVSDMAISDLSFVQSKLFDHNKIISYRYYYPSIIYLERLTGSNVFESSKGILFNYFERKFSTKELRNFASEFRTKILNTKKELKIAKIKKILKNEKI